jgi:hypothetical protein
VSATTGLVAADKESEVWLLRASRTRLRTGAGWSPRLCLQGGDKALRVVDAEVSDVTSGCGSRAPRDDRRVEIGDSLVIVNDDQVVAWVIGAVGSGGAVNCLNYGATSHRPGLAAIARKAGVLVRRPDERAAVVVAVDQRGGKRRAPTVHRSSVRPGTRWRVRSRCAGRVAVGNTSSG